MQLFEEPIDIISKAADRFGKNYSEMTQWQLGFLCGLINEYRPKKILEIGVSAGGTTAVILNALTILGENSKVYSVDFSEKVYKDESKDTGFVAKWAEQELKKQQGTAWEYRLFTRGGVCNFLSDIGEGIDFLILDTMHICPGEILDFLACFPFLTENCVVVMHDIAMQFANNDRAFATQLLLDSVTGEKIVGRDEETGFETYPNIGAFRINEYTERFIEDVFSSLNITWEYFPEEADLYREHFSKYYTENLIRLYDMAMANNKKQLFKRKEKKKEIIRAWTEFICMIENRDIYIYGNGNVAKRLEDIINGTGINILGHIISDTENKKSNELYLNEIAISDDKIIVIGVGKKLRTEIEKILNNAGINEYIVINDMLLQMMYQY